jgi:hypothetical protein
VHALWDTLMIERVSRSEDFWVADLAQVDSPDVRQEAMKGTAEIGRPSHYWPQGKPTKCLTFPIVLVRFQT